MKQVFIGGRRSNRHNCNKNCNRAKSVKAIKPGLNNGIFVS